MRDERETQRVFGDLLPKGTIFDKGTMRLTIPLENEEGEEVEHVFVCEFQVCDLCHGRGKHVSPSIDGDGLTADDFAEDPDFREAYMEGAYDVRCYRCKGEKVIPEIVEDRADPASLRLLHAWQREESTYRRTRESELELGF